MGESNMGRKRYELTLRYVEVEEVPGLGEDSIILDEVRVFGTEFAKGGKVEEDRVKVRDIYSGMIMALDSVPTIKIFRLVGLATDYSVVFFHFNIDDQTLLPFGIGLQNRGFGDPSKYLFMWVPSGMSTQEMYSDFLGTYGGNVPVYEHRQIFGFVSRNWDILANGTVLEMYHPEDDPNVIKVRKTDLRFTEPYKG